MKKALLVSVFAMLGFTSARPGVALAGSVEAEPPSSKAEPTPSALAKYGTAGDDRHVCLVYPTPRVGADCTSRSPQKVGPCGQAGRANVTELTPGATITVRFNETIDHPSHYRIAFNPNGDAFPDPTSVDDKAGGPLVLFDGVVDEEAGEQQIGVTFPNVECNNCTLQLIQVMYDKGGNGFGGRNAQGGNDDIYYSCADIVLRRR